MTKSQMRLKLKSWLADKPESIVDRAIITVGRDYVNVHSLYEGVKDEKIPIEEYYNKHFEIPAWKKSQQEYYDSFKTNPCKRNPVKKDNDVFVGYFVKAIAFLYEKEKWINAGLKQSLPIYFCSKRNMIIIGNKNIINYIPTRFYVRKLYYRLTKTSKIIYRHTFKHELSLSYISGKGVILTRKEKIKYNSKQGFLN